MLRSKCLYALFGSKRLNDLLHHLIGVLRAHLSSLHPIDGLEADNVSVEMVESQDTILTERTKHVSKGPKLSNVLSIRVAKESVPKLLGVLSVGGLSLLTALSLFFLRMRQSPSTAKA